MTKEEIDKLIFEGRFPEASCKPDLIETHISWVLLCEQFVYKIKKPIHYSFLDFSTVDKRKHYCGREIDLNSRFARDIYLDVQPVKKISGQFYIGNGGGEIQDYAVRMRRMDREKQMDLLLKNAKISLNDMEQLARKIAEFHRGASIICQKDIMDLRQKFNDIEEEKEFLRQHLNAESGVLIGHAIKFSNLYLDENKDILVSRLQEGFFRDGHGDLHTKNIFFLPSPQPFDCIEFNDDYRQVDVLNDVAFLCMDLDAFGRADLSEYFLKCYNNFFPVMRTEKERLLFIYYKSYRANIRAKINSLRAHSAGNNASGNAALSEAGKYLALMNSYIKLLEAGSG